MDSYLSIKEETTGSYKEKGSKFIAYAFPVSSEDEVKQKLNAIKKEHYSARHHCFAYVIGIDDKLTRAYDAGEPRHTAGDPILNQIRSVQLKDILVIVVRYFGGIKLGKSGLINAYKTAAQDVLSNTEIVEKVITKPVIIHFRYEGMNDIMHTLQQYHVEIIDQQYKSECSITCLLPASVVSKVTKILEGIKAVHKIEALSG